MAAPSVTVDAGQFGAAIERLAAEVSTLGTQLAETQAGLAKALEQLVAQQDKLSKMVLADMGKPPAPGYMVDLERDEDGVVTGMKVDRVQLAGKFRLS